MKMKFVKFFFTAAIILFAGFVEMIVAKPVNSDQAAKVAKTFYVERAKMKFKKIEAQGISMQLYHTHKAASQNVYYIFNVSGKKGFVVVSADDAAYPIIAYSFKGDYSLENTAPAQIEMMEGYEKQILDIKSRNLVAGKNIDNEWYRLLSGEMNEKAAKDVGPLLSTTWSQGMYYNTDCPADPDGPDGHAVVGCVATAMAQIMKYHQHPAQGTGSHSYYHPTYGTLSADFGSSTYDWASMPNSAGNYNSALALICYHSGVSVEMDYGPGASSTSTSYVANALSTYFGYDNTAYYDEKANYTNSDWESLLVIELDNGRPLEYRGSGPDGGHAFVCDGYQGTSNNHFHFNWGWGGYEDGYYYLSNLNPGSYTFNDGQAAVFGIQPLGGGGEYCTASGGCDEYISRVQLGSIDNSSTCDNYTDYTSLSTTVAPGSSYDITITNGNHYDEDIMGCWVDWNQDMDFEDAGEEITISYSNPDGTGTISVPADATPGQTRMRVRLQYGGTLDPCGDTDYGEVEDYTIEVQSGGGTYCDASGGCDEYISRVQLGSIDNSSDCDGYADYTSVSTNLQGGSSYDITITNGNHYDPDVMGCWIDWNQDQDFDDAGEEIDVFYSDPQGEATFTVPTDAVGGITRLRVRVQYGGTLDPCGDTGYGEVEDYSVNITGVNVNEIAQRNGILIYPNPASSFVNVQIQNDENNYQVEIFNCNGKKVMEERIPSGKNVHKLRLPQLSNGVYQMKIFNDKFCYIEKLMIK